MTSALSLNQKVILITGASKGIGQACAERCAMLGASLHLCGRDDRALHALSERLPGAHYVHCYDVTDDEQVKQTFVEVKKRSGQLDGLVNNAGIMLDAGFAMTPMADLDTQWRVNGAAAFLHAQYAARLMMPKKTGSIVNLCSIVGEQGSAGQVAYSMSKSALSGMTLSLAKELGGSGIRVNGVAPGFIETDMTAKYSADKRDNLKEQISLGRLGQPQEVANLISFLLGDDATYLTGQIIGVDGGLHL